MRIITSCLLLLLPFLSFGQGKVTIQETNNASSQSTSKTQPANKTAPNTKKRATIPPIKIYLAMEIDGQR